MELIDVNGVPLELQRIAAPDGAQARAPIIFLHEGLGSVALWRDWPAQVCAATGRAGFAYSRRGYGRSAPIHDVRGKGRHRPDYMHKEALEVLPALLQALGIARPVLLGHSDGGTIALIHAAHHPVAACVAMAPHVIVEDISVQAIRQAREDWPLLRERLARYHDAVEVAFWQWNDIWLDPAFRDFDIRSECRRIADPVLALQGREDAYGTLAQVEQIAPTRGRFEMQVIEQCGHSPHKDQPALVTGRIAEFLAGLA
ncbi:MULTISPECIES: alpha/beta fold hydrolase [Ramlibacter]|uniref:Alpha/beta fold hydrolase n=1 Tax=Ramlibacter aquaticus TaxID=2780094 RepID=A0ABR9SF69_9BURK|nr:MULTISPECIES: alpha/beta fold hydrolase [Ramlibacter]MBE7940910.1 alpha/beta fold hydrolase [Ramlibacter aquaticus]